MNISRDILILLIVLCVHSTTLATSTTSNVLLITIDGLRYDVLPNLSKYPSLVVPNLRAYVQQGALANASQSVFPASTYPSHTSMVTGVHPASHGIVTNARFDPRYENQEANWFYNYIQQPTLFDVIEQAAGQGYKSMSISWPVTTGSPVDLILPDAWADTPIDTDYLYNSIRGDFATVFPTPASLHQCMTVNYSTADRCRAALALSYLHQVPQPTLATVHLTDLDSAQHAHGVFPGHEAWHALERIDGYVGQIVKAFQEGNGNDGVVIIASDHGFVNLTTEINLATVLASFGFYTPTTQNPSNWTAYPYCSGGLCGVYTNPATMTAATQTMLDSVLLYLLSNPELYHISTMYNSSQVTSMQGYPGAYVVLEAEVGYTFAGAASGVSKPLLSPSSKAGGHGYSPLLPDMHGTVLLFGAGIKSNTSIGPVSVVDIAPTIAYLLGLDLGPQVQGKVLSQAFTSTVPPVSVAAMARESDGPSVPRSDARSRVRIPRFRTMARGMDSLVDKPKVRIASKKRRVSK